MSTETEMWGPDEATAPEPDDRLKAEQILAATAMAEPACVDDLSAKGFDPADIADERYRMVWYAVEELASTLTASAIRWQAVARLLQRWHAEGRMVSRPLTETDLGELYVIGQPGAAEWWANEVARNAVAARAAALGVNIRVRATNPAFDPDTDVAAIQSEVDALIRPAGQSQMADLGDLLPAVIERATTKPTLEDRVPTGFIDLDILLNGGWAGGQMVVIGARPAMGKSTLAACFARAAAITNRVPTAIWSLEMSSHDFTITMLCGEVKIPVHHLKRGEVDNTVLVRAAEKLPTIADAPLKIDDNPYLTLPGLRAQIRTLVRTFGLKVVFVDYLQLMQAPPAESRQVAVSIISRTLKLIAKEFGITVIVLAQLNRGNEQRSDKTPLVSDLRESGSIEQDADIVILLHREDAYEKESPRAGEADVIVGKHRGGAPGTVTVAAQLHYGRFVDMAES
ncbi:DnaB-like helicase C-terminal domain-containing protein [Streptomyces sp. NPDC056161]|uniref:DnaB-like helicase C-terminal domain-containing protein n=1 Tax=Streptomyces sp. NPDC056161 TaxID=3345732 RepID=UPI0035E0AD70